MKIKQQINTERPVFGKTEWIDLRDSSKRYTAQKERHADLQRKLNTGEIRYNIGHFTSNMK